VGDLGVLILGPALGLRRRRCRAEATRVCGLFWVVIGTLLTMSRVCVHDEDDDDKDFDSYIKNKKVVYFTTTTTTTTTTTVTLSGPHLACYPRLCSRWG
jgi:hypothetical protein